MMSDCHKREETSADRIARYKENRRVQLNAQIQAKLINSSSSSSSSDGIIRTTRASRLRAAATNENVLCGNGSKIRRGSIENSCEKLSNSPSTSSTSTPKNTTKSIENRSSIEKDKSSKRKSNLNRCLDSEEVPSSTDLNGGDGRRRRKIHPISNLSKTIKEDTPSSTPTKKTQLGIHMENARKGITVNRKNSTHKLLNQDDHTNNLNRINNITNLTKETLARVEKLTNRSAGNNSPHRYKYGPSILKKKSFDEPIESSPICSSPVSILKRKISQDKETSTPPVTFSPNVKEPSTRKQGILKKRRSLDESLVLRRRSYSPEVATTKDSKSILKNQQRRSSLEELSLSTKETQIQGILKRKTSKNDDLDVDQSFNSPQSILKRKSGASSAGSIINTPHVSITTAVILAAASGAEMVLEQPTKHRPILKKKSMSDEDNSDIPKPILKKKSIDDDNDEKLKPILKSARGSLDREIVSTKSKLLFNNDEDIKQERKNQRNTKRSNTICSENISVIVDDLDESNGTKRVLSVTEIVNNFERSTGAIPKRGNLIRNNERYKTQPVTSDEYEASLLYVLPSTSTSTKRYQENFSTSSFKETNLDLDNCPKLSSDSAFQSLLDEMEDLNEISPKNLKPKNDLMKNLANEAKNFKLLSDKKKIGNAVTSDKNKNVRHVTQPVTFDEVQEASKLQQDVPNKKMSSPITTVPDITYDEGISCNDSGSDSENATGGMEKSSTSSSIKKSNGTEIKRSFSARFSLPKTYKYVNESTSESESSGAKEVRSILGTDKTKIKQALEGLISSKNNNIGDERKSSSSLRRSHTVNYKKTKEGDMPQTIAELQATLQRKGDSEWRKRYDQNNSIDDELKLLKEKNKYNVELSEKTILASKKDELDAASKKWKCRVEKSDVDKFTILGKMESKETIPVNIPSSDLLLKKIPQLKRYKGKEETSASTPTSPEKFGNLGLKRSQSNPDPSYPTSQFNGTSQKIITKNVTVNRPDDFTFKNFYKKVDVKIQNHQQNDEINLEDFDKIEKHTLLVQKKNIQVQKRRIPTKNPIKALAERDDIKTEYTEILTGVAERETKRLNIEKLAKSSSNYAIEALAGLASKEDFKSIPLRKGTGPSTLLPYKDLMLIQIKGRRHVQLRLVEPSIESLNEGDCFLLITKNSIYNFIGEYSNVIEQSRASDIASHVHKTNDLGCKVNKVINIESKYKDTKDYKNFMKLLKSEDDKSISNAGNPSEDEIYESNILLTNMIYKLDNEELVPIDEYWGTTPKYEMLTSTSVYVFDFGTEMYVWSGKNALTTIKSKVLKLAKELWNEGFNYQDCTICPLNVALMLGDRQPDNLTKHSSKRPDWALFAKTTQHGETILFKEKFLDWPDFSRVIRIKRQDSTEKTVEATYDIKPTNVDEMLKKNSSLPDIVVEGTHLGRGDFYVDDETNRFFQFDTIDIKMWKIMENTYEKLEDKLIGQFYDGDSYIVKWKYRITVKGRELSGKPSKYCQVGRETTIFFYWQGCRSSINEKGIAALLTIELDNESAPQIRVTQGNEPPAFLQLFKGTMIIHKGKKTKKNDNKEKLYVIRGEIEKESYLLEVPCKSEQLRSRTSLVLFNPKSNSVTIWHGCKSSIQTRKVIKKTIDDILKNKFDLMHLDDGYNLKEIEEGEENDDFNRVLGVKRNSYVSLIDNNEKFDFTPRIFHFSSISGEFKTTEILCPHRSEYSSPLPIFQDQLYSASQPALFLIDNEYELWLWQGWWPELDDGGVNVSDQTGSGAIRWQAERRAAMKTAINYWTTKNGSKKIKANLVWAGLEPKEFQYLFPYWEEKEDATEFNIKEGKKMFEIRNLEEELALLSRTEFPLTELLERPLPEGVNPTHLEDYLSEDDFMKVLLMSKDDFQKLPLWKQTALKKEKGLF